jgi:capsular exopolysaccharide synthesis family protein
VADRFHKKVRDAAEAARLTGLDVIARVPPIGLRDLREGAVQAGMGPVKRARLHRRCKQIVASGGLLALMSPWSQIAEAYRALRVGLLRSKGGAPRVILVTGAGLGEGKTMSAANLALVLARGGARVVLVDADMRRPQIARRFRVAATVGLPEVLAGKVDLKRAMIPSPFPNLTLLPTARAVENPHDLLAGPLLAQVMELLRESFDHVVIDSPPMVPVADTAILSVTADAILLVARARHTYVEGLVHTVRLFRSLGVRPVGILFNMDRSTPSGRRYYRYYENTPRIGPSGHLAKLTAVASGPAENGRVA